MNINVKSLHNLTRQARAIKDRDKLSLTGQYEVRQLVKCQKVGIDMSELNEGKDTILKSKVCRGEALDIINSVLGLELYDISHDESMIMEYENLYGIPHALDTSMHIITLPYSIKNLEFTAEDYASSTGYQDRLFTAYGLLYLANKLNLDYDTCFIHYVYVDTPKELISEYDTESIHVFGSKLSDRERLVSIEVKLDRENYRLIEDSLDKTNHYIEEYKNKIK